MARRAMRYTHCLVVVVTLQIEQLLQHPNQRNTAAGHHAFFYRCTGCVQSIFNAGFLLFHFDFGGSAHFDYRNTASQLGHTLLQLFTVVVRAGVFDLRTNLLNTASIAPASPAPSTSGVFFGHGDALGCSQVLQSRTSQDPRPTSSEITVPPVKMAISSSIALRRSPNQVLYRQKP